MKKEEYLRCVTDQIRCKKACPGIEKELEDHITDQAEMYLKKGMTEEQALKKAIAEMGDPVQVGVELDRIHRPQMSWGLVLLAGILGIISIVLQYGLKSHGYEMGFPQRQLLFTVVGFVLMLGIYYLDYSILGKYGKWMAGVFLALMGLTIPCRLYMGGAGTYLRLGNMAVSVPLLMYLYVPLFGAVLYSYRRKGYEALWKIAGWMILPVGLVVQSASLIHAALLALALLMMVTIAIQRSWYDISKKRTLFALWGGGTAFFITGSVIIFEKILKAYQQERIQAYFDQTGIYGYMQNQIAGVFRESKMLGKSISGMKILESSLAGFNGELIWMSLIACFGIIAGMIGAGLYVMLIWKIFRISGNQSNELGKMIGYGCGLVFAGQIVYSFLICLNIVPEMPVILPFLSYGGSGTLLSYILMGLVLSVYRYKNIPLESQKRKSLKIRISVE